MKKAFDQTVRDLRREVNKKVLKVHGIEQKVLDATSNEPWGPHGAHLAEIAQATKNFHEYQLVMSVIWKRINDTGKNWRHVYKGLAVLEYLMVNGSERVIEEIREHAYQISTLSNFQYIDSSGRDQGGNVRKKAQVLVAVVSDREKLQEIRQKAAVKRDRSDAGTYKPGSYVRGYANANPYVDSRYVGHYRSRSEDSNGARYTHDIGNHSRDGPNEYQSGSRTNVEGDKKCRYDNNNDSDYQSPRNVGKRPSERDVHVPPSYEEAIREGQGSTCDESDARTKSEPQQVSSPVASKPSSLQHESTYQEQAPPVDTLISPHDTKGEIPDEFDPRGSLSAPNTTPVAISKEMDLLGSLLFDDSVNSTPPALETAATPSAECGTSDSIGYDDDETTLPSPGQIAQNLFEDSPFKAVPDENTTVHCLSTSSAMHHSGSETVDSYESAQTATSTWQTIPGFDVDDSLFGLTYTPCVPNDHPISAMPEVAPAEEPLDDVLAGILPQTGLDTAASTQMVPFTGPPRSQTAPPNILAQSASSSAYCPEVAAANPFAISTVLPQVTSSPDFTQLSVLASHGFTQNYASPSVPLPSQATSTNYLAQAGLSTAQGMQAASNSGLPPLKSTKPSEKFETKSAIWADTLSRGLINLDISGHKTNPLAGIGVDFDSINRREKRLEKEKPAVAPVSTITMGKAMGSGSGLGRAGATGLAPPPNPMTGCVMGMGMGMGMNVGYMGMAMGNMNPYRVGMNQQHMGIGMGMEIGIGPNMMGNGMGMNMPLQGGFQGSAPIGSVPAMPQDPAMPGSGYNPKMGMGNYGSQHQFGGGSGYK